MSTKDTDNLDPMSEVEVSPGSMGLKEATEHVNQLALELKRSAMDYSGSSMLSAAESVRYCRWAGQSSDGRKWKSNLSDGKEVFPWDGASDAKVMLADEVCNWLVDLTTTSFWRAMLKVSPVALDDFDGSSMANSLLDWTMNSQLFNDLTREVELTSQYLASYGWSGVHVTWQQEMSQKMQIVTMQQLVEMAQQSQPGSLASDFPAIVMNPETEDMATEIAMGAFGHLQKSVARMCIKQLRENGECEFPVPYLSKNQPIIAALCPLDELVFPPETTNIQSARVVFRRCYMTEIELRQKTELEGWDKKWADEAIATMGKFSNYNEFTYYAGLAVNALESRQNLIEVCYAYQKAMDQFGNPAVWCTVFSPQVGDKYGKFEICDYAHGQYPFVCWRSEYGNRKMIESRGAPYICGSWQNEAKVQHDSITDFTSLTTIPPIQVPKNRAGNLRIWPGGQLPVLRPGEVSYMAPPERDPNTAFMLLARIESEVDRYFGRPTEKVPPIIAQMRQQRLVSNWLHGWTEVFKQILSLQLEYMSPEEISRVIGREVDPNLMNQKYDVTLKFDVRELQTDLVTEKLKAISQLVLPMDSAGVIDKSKLMNLVLRAIDPTMAQELVIEKGPATQKMFDETNAEIGLMALGNPPKLRENDPTAQMRLQFVQQVIGSNPKYQQQIQSDQLFQENMKKYVENLNFSVTQQMNAITGRLGVTPS